MKKRIIALFLTAPAIAMASEPSSGTLIQISSVGSFVLISSLWALWSQRKEK
ncbi:MAG: hypothetical protein ACOCVG_04030 [Verrucomicrobiota bacterium]